MVCVFSHMGNLVLKSSLSFSVWVCFVVLWNHDMGRSVWCGRWGEGVAYKQRVTILILKVGTGKRGWGAGNHEHSGEGDKEQGLVTYMWNLLLDMPIMKIIISQDSHLPLGLPFPGLPQVHFPESLCFKLKVKKEVISVVSYRRQNSSVLGFASCC